MDRSKLNPSNRYIWFHRRKFGSKTSDNMDRWKSGGGKSQRREEQKREDQRRERVRRKKIQVREKVGKSRTTAFFQWFVALEGRKVGSVKRRVRSHVARWEMNNCTPFWHEAYLEIKMHKTHNFRTTFGSWDVEQVHAVVARSTSPRQNVQNTPGSEHFLKLRCRKSAFCCCATHISKSKVQKIDGYGAFLDVQVSFRVAGARDCALCQKWAKHEGFWHFQKRWQAWGMWRGSGKMHFAWQAQLKGQLGGQGADFLRGVAFWSIRPSVLGKWFCVTSAVLCMTWHHFFVASIVLQRHGLEKSQNALAWGRQLCTQLSIIEGSLAELLRFGCCPVQIMKKSRRIASFLVLPTSKIEEVSQTCCVFDVVEPKNWGSLAE